MVKTISHKENEAYFGEDKHCDIAQTGSFSELIFELLSGKRPTPSEKKIFELVLNLSIDHGPDTPSAVATIEAAKVGQSISEAVSSGIEQINDSHGGAIEPAMALFYRVKREGLRVKDLIPKYLNQGKRVAGFGHRIYEVD